jgi:hypothetical protein
MRGWKTVEKKIDTSVSLGEARAILREAGFREHVVNPEHFIFKRSGTQLTFKGERAPIDVAVAKTESGLFLQAKYDTFVLFDTGDLAKVADDLAAKLLGGSLKGMEGALEVQRNEMDTEQVSFIDYLIGNFPEISICIFSPIFILLGFLVDPAFFLIMAALNLFSLLFLLSIHYGYHPPGCLFVFFSLIQLSIIANPTYITYRDEARASTATICLRRIDAVVIEYVELSLRSKSKGEWPATLKTILIQIDEHRFLGGDGKQLTSLLPKDSFDAEYIEHWTYEIYPGLKGVKSDNILEYCIKAKEKDKKGNEARYVLFSSVATNEPGWNSKNVNKVNYESGKTPKIGGCCNSDGSFNPNFR